LDISEINKQGCGLARKEHENAVNTVVYSCWSLTMFDINWQKVWTSVRLLEKWRLFCCLFVCSIFILLSRESDGAGSIFWTNLHPLRSCPFPSFPVVSLTYHLICCLFKANKQSWEIIKSS